MVKLVALYDYSLMVKRMTVTIRNLLVIAAFLATNATMASAIPLISGDGTEGCRIPPSTAPHPA